MNRLIYRAGYPSTGGRHLVGRRGRWLRIGPYVIGNVTAWDRSGWE